MKYPITEIFCSLQGEGHFVGYPMVFVRLAGCSVHDCHIRRECDEAPWKAREYLDVEEIVGRTHRAQPRGIVCITGGEPTDHDLVPMIAALKSAGMRVHLETSGVRSVAGFPIEWLTVSPKLAPDRLKQRNGHALKVVVRPEWSNEEACSLIQQYSDGTEFFHRYLQPLTIDGKPVNLKQVMTLLLHPIVNSEAGWALSTQAHRIWGLP